jgi:hypothetical protein
MSLTDEEGAWLDSDGGGCADRPAVELGEGLVLSKSYCTPAGPGWTVELRIGSRVPSSYCLRYDIKEAMEHSKGLRLWTFSWTRLVLAAAGVGGPQ